MQRIFSIACLDFCGLERPAINLHQQEFGEMGMNGVRPVFAFIAYGPDLGTILLDFSIGNAEAGCRLAVYRPHAASVIERPYSPLPYLAQAYCRNFSKRGWDAATVSGLELDYVETHHVVAWLD